MSLRKPIFAALAIAVPTNAWAIIPHDYPGYYPHQTAHILFSIALSIFILYICRHRLYVQKGWFYIAVSSALLFFWNIFTFLGHIVELYIEPSSFIDRDSFTKGAIKAGPFELLYYVYRMDTFILLMSVAFLYTGVKWHLREAEKQ